MALMGSNNEDVRIAAKADLIARTGDLMPSGVPNYVEVRFYPSIAQLIAKEGKKNMVKLLHLLVSDFCASFNVVRNMTDDQMIETAGFLLDECGNFRLEDYQMMLTMAKRGKLVDIRDRIDIQVFAKMLDAYWALRDQAGKQIQETEVRWADNEINSKNVTFAPAISEALTKWIKQLPEEEAKEIDKSGVEAYARLNNVDMNEVVKQFGHGSNESNAA